MDTINLFYPFRHLNLNRVIKGDTDLCMYGTSSLWMFFHSVFKCQQNSPFLFKKESCLFMCYIYIGALDIQTSAVWSFLIVEIWAMNPSYFRFLDILTVAATATRYNETCLSEAIYNRGNSQNDKLKVLKLILHECFLISEDAEDQRSLVNE